MQPENLVKAGKKKNNIVKENKEKLWEKKNLDN